MDHYTHLASHYDEYYRYSDGYVNYFTDKIVEDLAIKKNETIVEVGSGTGIFAKEILKKIPSLHMICVDNSAIMLNRNKDERIMQICEDAVAFSRENIAYDKVYMKEFIHHISRENRLNLFRGLYSQLKNNGSLLILVEPGRLNYPLFDEALWRFESRQPSHLQIINELHLAGFSTSFSVKSYPISLAKSKYIEMVRNRYMSVLECFTDAELEKGITSIYESQKNDELEFLETFYSIKAVKSTTSKKQDQDHHPHHWITRLLPQLQLILPAPLLRSHRIRFQRLRPAGI
jgi:ubiquinone/menaquinone biosynthesis C-methylase UbiE